MEADRKCYRVTVFMHFVITHMCIIRLWEIENLVSNFRENVWDFNAQFYWNSHSEWFEVSYLALNIKNLNVLGEGKLYSPLLEIIQPLVFSTDLIYKAMEKIL